MKWGFALNKIIASIFKITLGLTFAFIAIIRHPDSIIMAEFTWFHEPYADSTILDYVWYFCTLSSVMFGYLVLLSLLNMALKQNPVMNSPKYLTIWVAITSWVAFIFHPHGIINIQFDDHLFRNIWLLSYIILLLVPIFLLLKPTVKEAKN